MGRRVVATSFVGCLCLCAALWFAVSSPTDAARLVRKPLLEDRSGTRLLQARLSDLAFKPHPEPRRSSRTPDIAHLHVAARLTALAHTFPPDSSHRAAATGLALLYQGEVDPAIDWLREATELEPLAADYWTDYAAASLTRGNPTDLLEALEASENALAISPGKPAAAFNQAQALESLGLGAEAKARWARVASLEEGSDWSREALDRAAGIRTPKTPPSLVEFLGGDRATRARYAEESLDAVRQLLDAKVMPSIGTHCQDARATRCLDAIRAAKDLAVAGASVSPDSWWTDTSLLIETWLTGGVPPADAAALRDYGRATLLFGTDQVAAAAVVFTQLASADRTPQLPVHWNAVYQTCVDEYFQSRHAVARRCLATLERAFRRRNYLFLLGKVEWLRAQASLAEGNLARALSEFDRAASALESARDKNQLAALHTLKATVLDQLGEFNDAWRSRVHAFRHAQLDYRRRHTLLTSAARSCLLQHLPHAAAHFQRAAIANATAWAQDGALIEAHAGYAIVLQRKGDWRKALEHVKRARNVFARLTDERARTRFEGELAVLEGEVLSELDPAAALGSLRRAERQLGSVQLDLLQPRLQRAIGIASERSHLPGDALLAYERAVRALKSQQRSLTSAARMQSTELAWDIYERLFRRRLHDLGHQAAFEGAESARAQVLAGSFESRSEALTTLAQVPGFLRPGTVIMYFVVLEDELLKWTISTEGIHFSRIPVGRMPLEQQIRRLVRKVEGGRAQRFEGTEEAALYDLLVSPGNRTATGTTIVIVPDGPLHALPFGLLRNAKTNRFLIEDHPVAVAPSLRVFAAASRSASVRFRRPDTALVVGGRVGALTDEPLLPLLPGAEREIRAVAAAYKKAVILEGADATPDKFLEQAGLFPVVHFAGHAQADRVFTELSRLFMAPSADRPTGWLLASDLEAVRMPNTGLVVLGACGTGAGRILRGEGVASLARPFLARGVAAVVYSLWDISDQPSAAILSAFHADVASGVEPVVALQRAQIGALRSEDPMHRWTWAAFQYSGGLRLQDLN